jgi:hypothetical protein
MTFRVIRKVVEHKFLYKFGLKQNFIHLTVLEIEREEWGAFIRMCDTDNARRHCIIRFVKLIIFYKYYNYKETLVIY